jgi:hypothetical protein
MEADGVTYKKELKDYYVITDTITEDLQIDTKTIEEYNTKLKTKNKSYEGGAIILSEYESPSQTSAFSRTNTLNHYLLFIYPNSVEKKEDYAHEIGHMLGLPHSFFTDKEKESYKIARENILGNNESRLNSDGTKNDKYRSGIIKHIEELKNSRSNYYGWSNLKAIKEDIIKFLNKYNASVNTQIANDKREVNTLKEKYKNYDNSYQLTQTQTKKQYFEVWNESIRKQEKYVADNRVALEEIQKLRNGNYIDVKSQMWFHRTDLIKLLQQSQKYYQMIIDQTHKNYLFFKKASTKNILDYDNKRFFYNHNQIIIMRSDIQNYMQIPCEFCR